MTLGVELGKWRIKTRDHALESENPYIAFHCASNTMKKGLNFDLQLLYRKQKVHVFELQVFISVKYSFRWRIQHISRSFLLFGREFLHYSKNTAFSELV